jgi:hypothetical protein
MTPAAAGSATYQTPKPTATHTLKPTAKPTPTPTPKPTPTPTPTPKPTRPAVPTHTAFSVTTRADSADVSTDTYHVSWREANSAGVTVRIYALLLCLGAASAAHPSVPCVTANTSIPAHDLLLIAQVRASAGTFTWAASYYVGEGSEIGYVGHNPGTSRQIFGVFITAANKAGSSRRVVVASSEACYECTL